MIILTQHEIELLQMSISTRIQRVEELIKTFEREHDEFLLQRYNEELNDLKKLRNEIQ